MYATIPGGLDGIGSKLKKLGRKVRRTVKKAAVLSPAVLLHKKAARPALKFATKTAAIPAAMLLRGRGKRGGIGAQLRARILEAKERKANAQAAGESVPLDLPGQSGDGAPAYMPEFSDPGAMQTEQEQEAPAAEEEKPWKKWILPAAAAALWMLN